MTENPSEWCRAPVNWPGEAYLPCTEPKGHETAIHTHSHTKFVERHPIKVVHVLLHGLPLCGFTTLVPRAWPAGHRWIGKDQREDPKAKEKACKDCYDNAKTLEEAKDAKSD